MVERPNLDPQIYFRERLKNLDREFQWSEGKGEDWKDQLRTRLAGCIGLPKGPYLATSPQIGGPVIENGLEFRSVTFEAAPGRIVCGYLIAQPNSTGPGIVCVPGHGEGVDAIVGKTPEEYQHRFALQFANAGFTVLAIEQMSFGHRMAPGSEDKGSSCHRDSMTALMLGETMIGIRTHDTMAAVDLLAAQPSVDSKRIAVAGISGGGLSAYWAACFDDRITATLVSGYLNTFADSILGVHHCVDNYSPGLANLVEMPDMAALIAPRKLFAESGDEDPIFPPAAFQAACQRVQAIYKDANAPENFKFDLFSGGHFFNGLEAIPTMREWFQI